MTASQFSPQQRFTASDRLPVYPALDAVTRPMLTTDETAYYVNRKPQTLRVWACTEAGPLRPVRLHGRLGWPTDAVRRYLGVDTPKIPAPDHPQRVR